MASLAGSFRTKSGCRRWELCQSVEDEDRLFLLEEWDNEENLLTHLTSYDFKVFRGAMSLLKEPDESWQGEMLKWGDAERKLLAMETKRRSRVEGR